MARIPSPEQIAELSRNEWEELCRGLAILIYQAEGVEDRKGKGNGLDAIRVDADHAYGWQFRRFDGRLGDSQVSDIKHSIRLAVERCKKEEGVNLRRYAIWANIDLEPGHMKQIGERERIQRLRLFARSEYGVELDFVGLTWVRTQLLSHPQLRPDLFEDIQDQIKNVHDSLKNETQTILASLRADTGNMAVARLAEQASVHFQRGQRHGIGEEFRHAERCLLDALNLLSGLPVDALLQGKVLIALAGVRTRLGNFDEALAASKQALNIIPPDESFLRGYAFGNMGIAYGFIGNHTEARRLHQVALGAAEDRGDAVGVVIALTHLLELEINCDRAEGAGNLAERLTRAYQAIEGIFGAPSDVSLAARGALAGRLLAIGITKRDRGTLEDACVLFDTLADLGLSLSLHLWASAKLQCARGIWNLDKLEEAEHLYTEVVCRLVGSELDKLAADARFNLALVKYESSKTNEAIAEMEQARANYREMGDWLSEADAEEKLTHFGGVR